MLSIGAHVDPLEPLVAGRSRQADNVQFFLTDPQGWKAPPIRSDAEDLRASDLALYVHAPYVINVATSNNRIRIPSRKLLIQHAEAAAAIGAEALIVHAGHLTKGEDPQIGVANWQKTFQRNDFPLPILIENTAGGVNSVARRLDRLALLWDAIGDYGVGFCLDTCHAHAGGEELIDLVRRVRAITGRIDLVHANNSKDDFNSGRDRHENLLSGLIDPATIVAVIAAAGAPVVCETPNGEAGQISDIAFLRDQLGCR